MKQIESVIKQFQNRELDNCLADIYGEDTGMVEEQTSRYLTALESYKKCFGDGEVEIYSAPGRTEIGGNHTDHQHGMVLAASVNLDTIAVAGYCDKNTVEFVSEGYEPISIPLDDFDVDEKEYGTTASLIKGVIAGMQNHGYKTGPFRAYVTSSVPGGAGLSSSAAFETVIGTILSGLYNDKKISPIEIAIIGQYAENVYFGKPCGLMDQMACSVGGIVHIDFKNPTEPVVERVEFDIAEQNYSLCIVDTKGSHADLTPDYAAIPQEMKEIADFFGKEVLREVPEEVFYEKLPELYQKKGDRGVLRAIHFFAENRRVQKEVDALKQNRFDDFLRLVKASGDSSYKYLQNIYSNHQEQNQPIATALALSDHILGEDGVSRVHGGGFAGTIQSFVKNNVVSVYQQQMECVFGGGVCHIIKIRKYGGVKII